MSDGKPCPCQSGLAYESCCGPYHAGQLHAPTALALMRSRYSAYVLELVDYILNTTHRDNPQYRKNTKVWRSEVLAYCKTTEFLDLAILESEPGDSTATVTFQAKLTLKGIPTVMTEKSRFVKIGQRWLYHSGAY